MHDRVEWTPSRLQQERDAFRRRRTRRTVAVSTGAFLLVLLAIALVLHSSSGWARTRHTFFDFADAWSGLPDLLRALWVNLQVMAISEVLILVFGALLATLRTLPGARWYPVRLVATIYVDVFRGLPLLIVFLLIGFGIPALRISGAPTSPFTLSIISLTLTYSAYVAEVLRAGIESVHPSQRAAARSLGLSYGQALRHVVFPQAVRRVLPPLLNDFVSLQKDTSLIYLLSVVDVVLTAYNQTALDYNYTHYVLAGLIFLVLTIPFTRLTDWVARRQGWRGAGGGAV